MTEPILPLGAVSRRDFMSTVGVIGAAWLAAAACASDAAPAATPVASPKMAGDAPAPAHALIHFTPAQAAEIDAISARIIPTDEAPGAHEAGVLYFIDRSMTTFAKEQTPLFEGGLASIAKAVEKGHGASAKFSTLMIRTMSMPPDGPQWGGEFKKRMRSWFLNSLDCYGHTTSLPVATNSVSLDPELKDAWGLPAMRITYKEHEHDLKLYKYFQERGRELLTAAGAVKITDEPIKDEPGSTVHLLGTARMGNDPRSSVVDKYHRAHDVKNLFIVDGSSFVTSGRGQPTMTIQALAFRAADHIAQFAKQREI